MGVQTTGVSTASASAVLAIDLLLKVMEVSSSPEVEAWTTRARQHSATLRQASEQDIAAYNRYLREGTAALSEIIEVPMQAARACAAALDLCVAQAPSVRKSVSADLGVAASLLAAAVQGILLCVDANLRQAPADPHYVNLRAEQADLEHRARAALQSVIAAITSVGLRSN